MAIAPLEDRICSDCSEVFEMRSNNRCRLCVTCREIHRQELIQQRQEERRAMSQSHLVHKFNTRQAVRAVSYQPIKGIPEDDYLDFEGRMLDWKSFTASLELGNMPPGLIVEKRGAIRLMVRGDYGQKQEVVRI